MNSLFLQSNELAQDAYWIAGAVIVLLLAILYYRKVKRDQMKRMAENHDPRSHVVNDTNYNINREGVDGHRTDGMDTSEANTVVEGMRATDTIPTDKEFRALREDLRKE
ncbi:MAG: hypothetical protein AAFN92_00925 [Bacteroidota bacterium]